MLTVETYLSPSQVNGIGLFAAEDIQRGQLIWEYHPGVDITFDPQSWQELLDTLSPQSRSQVQKYVYKSKGQYFLCVDNGQFMNHHPTMANVINDPIEDRMFAKSDIKKGEELLCDYREYSDPDDPHLTKVPV